MSEEHRSYPDPASWLRISELFEGAAELPPDLRDGWLDSAAASEPLLIETVRRMLAADSAEGGILDEGIAPAAHLVLEEEPVLAPGTAVGAFDIIGELDRGGMGIVYAARDRHLDRPVALKFIQARAGSDRGEAQRVLAEAKAASALDHPNVAAIYQVGESDDGRYFIAMPRYEGETLGARLKRGPVPASEALAIGREVAAGLAAAHRAGIVHRDVTPGNIFLTSDGSVRLLDFGLAALTGAHASPDAAAGTIPYMSPEQTRGDPTDARTDVWSLGVVLYRMLAGALPFTGPAAADIIAAIRGTDPAPSLQGRAGIQRPLAHVVKRALRKEPAERFADAGAMLEALATPRQKYRLASAAAAVAVLAMLTVTLASPGWLTRRNEVPGAEVAPPTVLLQPPDTGTASEQHTALAAALLDEAGDRLTMLGRVRVLDGEQVATPAPDWYQLELSVTGDSTSPTLTAVIRRTDEELPLRTESRALRATDARALTRWLTSFLLAGTGVVLAPREQATLAASFPSSVEAYQAFLAGNLLLQQRTPASVIEAMQHYRRAQRQDSTFVGALAREAYAMSLMLDWGWQVPGESRSDVLARGMALSTRALALDTTSAEAWLARAYLMVARDPRRLSGAPDAFRRAIALDPYNAEAYHQYGQAEMVLGRYTEATSAYRRALELQPDAGMTLVAMAGIAEMQGQRPEALRLLDSAVAVAPAMAFARAIRAHVRALAGDAGGAMDDAVAALPLDPDFRVPALSALAVAAHASGDTADAVGWLRQTLGAFNDSLAPSPDEAQLAALAALARNRQSLAVGVLERARPRGAALWYLFQHPAFAELRSEPRAHRVLSEADPRQPATEDLSVPDS